MDPVSQIALSAAVGGAVMGSRVGRKALVWGSILGVLPDLDVLIPYANAVEAVTHHRGFSHSLVVHTALSPLIAGVIVRLHPQSGAHYYRWALAVWLCLVTHAVLDCFTIYGTQIFWPQPRPPVGWGSVFIIDPLYTLPLLFAVVAAVRYRRHLLRLCLAGLLFSSVYLVISLYFQEQVADRVERYLRSEDIAYNEYLVTSGPFSILWWRILVMSDAYYYEGVYSLFDTLFDDRGLQLDRYVNGHELLQPLSGTQAVRSLLWFTKGFYAGERRGNEINMIDLRMGMQGHYSFSYRVGRINGPENIQAAEPLLNDAFSLNPQQWHWLWERTFALTDRPMPNGKEE